MQSRGPVWQASRVHIKDPAVSENHGVLSWTAGGWVVVDSGSSNGTLVNGERLRPAGGAPTAATLFVQKTEQSGFDSAV